MNKSYITALVILSILVAVFGAAFVISGIRITSQELKQTEAEQVTKLLSEIEELNRE